MIYGFDTDDPAAATAALVLYVVYRSRDRGRFKVTPDMWEKIERFLKASAKRAANIPQLIEALKPRLVCGTLHPRYMAVGMAGLTPLADGSFARIADQREFLTAVLAQIEPRAVVQTVFRETAWVVLLVRDRLERERPFETQIEIDETAPEEL